MNIKDIIPGQHYKIKSHVFLPSRWNVRMKKYMGKTVKIKQVRQLGGIVIYQERELERLWIFTASDFVAVAASYHLPNELFEI